MKILIWVERLLNLRAIWAGRCDLTVMFCIIHIVHISEAYSL